MPLHRQAPLLHAGRCEVLLFQRIMRSIAPARASRASPAAAGLLGEDPRPPNAREPSASLPSRALPVKAVLSGCLSAAGLGTDPLDRPSKLLGGMKRFAPGPETPVSDSAHIFHWLAFAKVSVLDVRNVVKAKTYHLFRNSTHRGFESCC